MSIDLSHFHGAFFEEALDSLDQAECALLCLEKQQDIASNIDATFRSIHSIKGSAGTLGFEQIANFSHHLEAVLETYRGLDSCANLNVQGRHISLIFACLDLLRAMVANAQQKQGEVSPSRVHALKLKLDDLQIELDAFKPSGSSGSVPKDSSPLYASEFTIAFRPHPEMLSCGNDPLRYLDALAGLGAMHAKAHWEQEDLLDAIKKGSEKLNESCVLHWTITLETTLAEQEVRSVFEWVEDICDLQISAAKMLSGSQLSQQLSGGPLADPLEDKLSLPLTDDLDRLLDANVLTVGSHQAEYETGRKREQRSIQVSTEKIDDLLGHLADLAMFQVDLEAKTSNQETLELFNRLARQTRQLQDAILAMRMSPIATLFKRFERVIRDAELDLGKRVKVNIEGENTELDSSIIERLIDPVTHLIRNALGHGIELPGERRTLGKPEIATLSLHAEQRGSRFVLTIEDDGRGLDIQAIRAKAIEKGLAHERSIRTDEQWAELIFSPGFSTINKATQWSGRGVGLDAVVAAIKSLRGELSVRSVAGEGTRFAIFLPLTLALADALVVECDGEQYALVLSSIGECIQTDRENFRELPNGQKLYQLREKLLPYANLGELMEISQSETQAREPLGIVIGSAEAACLIFVSRIVGERQIVVKNIEKNLGATKFYQSATIIGEGKVVFVLDTIALSKSIGTMPLALA
jgi:two-component system, chemotaxis family, sensor kinase CheA